MQLIEINKERYRKHLNKVIIGFVASFMVLSLAIGQGLISVFSDPNSDNFNLNLTGVIIALFICGGVLQKLKHSAFFHEIYYVWQLKQLQNKVFRKMKTIKKAAENDNVNAYIVLYFYYSSLRQVYLLDDNTLTINKVNSELSALTLTTTEKGIKLDELSFEPSMILSVCAD